MKKLLATVAIFFCICATAHAYQLRPESQANTYTDSAIDALGLTDGTADLDVNSISVNGDGAGGVILPNSAVLPTFDDILPDRGATLIHYNNVIYYRTTDANELTFLKLVADNSIVGSYFGNYYKTGVDLSDATYTEVFDLLYSYRGSVAGAYDYTAAPDSLTLSNTGAYGTPAISLVSDADRGVVVSWTLTGTSGGAYATRLHKYRRVTGINGAATGWFASAWVRPVATAPVVVGSPLGAFYGVFVEATDGIGMGAVYGDDGALDGIGIASFDSPVLTLTTLYASALAGEWYHVLMICDGTTGIDYYVTDVDGNLVASGDEGDVALASAFNTWGASYYGEFFQTGYGATSITGSLTDARLDKIQFHTLD